MKARQCISSIILSVLFTSTNLYSQTTIFNDDFENGTTNWALTGSWGLASNEYNSTSNSLTESPVGNYTDNLNISATLVNSIDLSGYLGAEISFWSKYDIEAAFDFLYFEISKDGGNSFIIIDEFTDVSLIWNKHTYNIGNFAGCPNVIIRFRFFSDQYVNGDGIYIDDFELLGTLIDSAPPLIVHDGPVFYEGTSSSFTVDATISDVSGISSANLFYIVDGSGPFTISGTNVSSDNYQFTIPAQPAGSHISYKIKAVDNSVASNETDTSAAIKYQYISGSYLSYDDGIVNAVQTISGSSAAAVKISIPSGKYGFLKTVLIRNYRDVNHTNDNMLFHVWENANGVPGSDLITPFLVTPEATLDNPFPFTRIDLRGYSPQLDDLTGDIFIGFTVPQNSVSAILSNNSSGRSYIFNGTDWVSNSKDFEFRAIIFESSAPLPVELTTFETFTENENVSLSWVTQTEVNNYGFEIERHYQRTSIKNQASSIETQIWEKIGFIEGNGNSNSPKYYSFEDESILESGIYSYRLKQIDIDGKFEYSKVVEVNITSPDKLFLAQNYPNPFNPITKISYNISGKNTSNVLLTVYNLLGKEVEVLVDEKKSPGKYEVSFDASNYPSGLYIYTLKTNNYKHSRKMLLMK